MAICISKLIANCELFKLSMLGNLGGNFSVKKKNISATIKWDAFSLRITKNHFLHKSLHQWGMKPYRCIYVGNILNITRSDKCFKFLQFLWVIEPLEIFKQLVWKIVVSCPECDYKYFKEPVFALSGRMFINEIY